MIRHTAFGLVTVLLPTLAGCAPATPAGYQAGRGSVTSSVWALRSLQDRDVPRSRPEAVTLRLLPDHAVAGTSSCNSVGGRELAWFASTDSQGTFAHDPSQPLITTVVGCNDTQAIGTAHHFWTLMTNAKVWSIDHRELTIRFDDSTTALLKPIGPTAGRSDDCRNADPNNFDCPRTGHERGAKPQ